MLMRQVKDTWKHSMSKVKYSMRQGGMRSYVLEDVRFSRRSQEVENLEIWKHYNVKFHSLEKFKIKGFVSLVTFLLSNGFI